MSQTDYSAIFPYLCRPIQTQNFDDIKPSTRTCIARLHSNVALKAFYENAQLANIQQPKIKRKKLKIQQLEIGPPGSIISMLYDGVYKGVQTRQNPQLFLNQLTFIMSLDSTNVNFKLFQNGVFQATGCKTKQHEYDIARFLVEEGRRIERENPDVVIFDKEPVINDSTTVMINIDFKLGFNIDRKALNKHIAGLNGFESTFDENLTNSGVSVKMPRSAEENSKKDTFICFHTGTVLLSGDDLERMKKLYYKFLETIDTIKYHIVTSYESIKFDTRRYIKVKLVE